jgi:hypothetical protein
MNTEIQIHLEPAEFKNWPAENCSVCKQPTRFWKDPHTPLCESCAAAINAQRTAGRLAQWITDALPIVRDYAKENPKWTARTSGDPVEQDPMGAHGLIKLAEKLGISCTDRPIIPVKIV